MPRIILTDEFVKEWDRVRSKLDNMRGPGVANTSHSITINAVQGDGGRQFPVEKDYFRVKTKNGSGSDGSATTAPAYVYDVYALDGTTLIESGVAVIGPRPNGLTTKAPDDSYAQATHDKDGALKLWFVLEKPTDDSCT